MNLVSRNQTRPLNIAAMLLLAGVVLLASSRLFAQTNTSVNTPANGATRATSRPSNRFLFIVDTSSAMRKKSADAIRAVENILHSAASGQIHMGDTIGMWTFNETLYVGKFPLQQWGRDDGDEIALRAAAFLREQKFEKASQLEPALNGMQQVVKGSDIITVFIVSDGSGRMQGTPFDDQINAQYQQNVQEMKKDPQPIITVLQARGGELVNFTVNRLPWPVVIPPLPIPLKKQIAAAPPAASNVVAKAAPASVAQLPSATNAAPQAVATSTPPTPITNVPAQPNPVAAPQNTAAVPTTVTPPVVQPSATASPSVGPPTSEIIAGAKQQAAAQASNGTVAAATVKPAETAVAPPKPAPASNALPAVPRPVASASTNAAAAPAAPKPAAKPPVSNAPSNTVAKVEPHPDTSSGTNTLAMQAGALVRRYTAGPSKYYLLGGVAFLFIGLWVLKAMIRRANKRAKISLITQSLQNQDHF